jgi:membrane protein involved in colicin uptake
MSDSTLITLDAQKLIEQVSHFCENEIVALDVTNAEQHKGAGELGKRLKQYERDLEKQRKELKEPYLEKGREIDSTFKKVTALVKSKVGVIAGAIRKYENEQEQKRIEAQRKADEAARKERERIEAKAQKEREKAEEARRAAAEAARKAQEAQDERERKRLEAEARRKEQVAANAEQRADTKEDIAATVVAPVVGNEEEAKVDGVSRRKNWKAEVTDLSAFVAWVVKTENYHLVEADQKNLNKYAKMVEDTKQVPGVRIFNDESTTFRG